MGVWSQNYRRWALGSRSAFIQKMDKIDSLELDGLGTNKKQKKKSLKGECSIGKNRKIKKKRGDKVEKKEKREDIEEVYSARKIRKNWEYGVKSTGFDGRMHWLPWSNHNDSCREN